MTTFAISEDFPKWEVEFHARLSDPKGCYEYLFKQKWPRGFICKRCGNQQYWHSKRNLYICTEMSASAFTDGRNHNGQLEITDYQLVQGHVVVHYLKSGINTVNVKDLMYFGGYDTAWTWLQ